jgi:hypothetical protein
VKYRKSKQSTAHEEESIVKQNKKNKAEQKITWERMVEQNTTVQSIT